MTYPRRITVSSPENKCWRNFNDIFSVLGLHETNGFNHSFPGLNLSQVPQKEQHCNMSCTVKQIRGHIVLGFKGLCHLELLSKGFTHLPAYMHLQEHQEEHQCLREERFLPIMIGRFGIVFCNICPAIAGPYLCHWIRRESYFFTALSREKSRYLNLSTSCFSEAGYSSVSENHFKW